MYKLHLQACNLTFFIPIDLFIPLFVSISDLIFVERAVFISLYQHMYTNSDHYAVAKMS